MNVYINVKNKRYGEALLSQNGLTGFIFYSYIVSAFILSSLFNINITGKFYLFIFILIPILIFFFKHPLEKLMEGSSPVPKQGWGGFVLETVFEVFEILLSFITNTLSYLRVGGFVLSHAGMMLVVMTLVKMTGKAGILVFIGGNLFVIMLEGLIVGIQTLRLEYYEMFSRYYNGGGKEYRIITYED